MHIAICDDNMADRKQLERLLKRAGDTRLKDQEGFYIDSYGNTDALMRSPMLYDLFFLDLCHGDETGLSVCQRLLDYGVTAPVVLCSSLIRYEKQPLPERVLTLSKPVRPGDLEKLLDYAGKLLQDAPSRIELREETGRSFYLKEEDFVSATAKGRYLTITLKDQQEFTVLSTIDNLYSQLDNYPTLFPLNGKTLVNGRYLAKIRGLTGTLTNQKSYHISPRFMAYAKYAMQQFSLNNHTDTPERNDP